MTLSLVELGAVPVVMGTVMAAVMLFLVALRRRSWPLWLAGYLTTLAALTVAWRLR